MTKSIQCMMFMLILTSSLGSLAYGDDSCPVAAPVQNPEISSPSSNSSTQPSSQPNPFIQPFAIDTASPNTPWMNPTSGLAAPPSSITQDDWLDDQLLYGPDDDDTLPQIGKDHDYTVVIPVADTPEEVVPPPAKLPPDYKERIAALERMARVHRESAKQALELAKEYQKKADEAHKEYVEHFQIWDYWPFKSDQGENSECIFLMAQAAEMMAIYLQEMTEANKCEDEANALRQLAAAQGG